MLNKLFRGILGYSKEGSPNVQNLRNILEEEKSLLLKGDLGELSRMSNKKMEFVKELLAREADMPASSLTELKAKINENQSLIFAAKDAVSRVKKRFVSKKEGFNTVRYYNANGKMQDNSLHTESMRKSI
ncbi:MAG: hypothetical protein ACPGNV_14025 [Mangrovicoccus sp.]